MRLNDSVTDVQAKLYSMSCSCGNQDIYTVSQKSIHDVSSYNLQKHCQIFIIFGRNSTEKVSNQKMLYISTSPN